MAFLEEIRTQIITILGGAPLVTCGTLSTSVDVCTAIYETGGAGADLGLGVDGIQYEYPAIQVVCRGAAKDYATPRATMQLIYKGLPKVQAEALSGVYYHTIRPMQAPFVLRRDENERVLVACNFLCTKEPS
jgi:hypothetical protein